MRCPHRGQEKEIGMGAPDDDVMAETRSAGNYATSSSAWTPELASSAPPVLTTA